VAPCTHRGKKKKEKKRKKGSVNGPSNQITSNRYTHAHGKTKTKELELKSRDNNGETKMKEL
jgi:hypothetical protein